MFFFRLVIWKVRPQNTITTLSNVSQNLLQTALNRHFCRPWNKVSFQTLLLKSNIYFFCTVSFMVTAFENFTFIPRLQLKVKVPAIQATKARRVGRGIAITNLRPRHWRWGWGVITTPQPLYPRERPGTHCTGGWVGPRAGLDGCGKSRPHRYSIPRPSST